MPPKKKASGRREHNRTSLSIPGQAVVEQYIYPRPSAPYHGGYCLSHYAVKGSCFRRVELGNSFGHTGALSRVKMAVDEYPDEYLIYGP